MTDSLEINGKILHPIRKATQTVSYSRDYITRLARDKKIIGAYIGRQWFIDLDSLKQYIETINLEQEIRNKQLSEERRRERDVREAVEYQNTLRLKKAQSLNLRALTTTSLVLCFGLLSGFATHKLISFSESSGFQVASTHSAQELPQTEKNSEVLVESDEGSTTIASGLTQKFTSIDNVQNGILLIPNNASTTTIEEMLSDKVVVQELTDGTQVVVRVDEEGKIGGNSVPFVVVPVEHQKI